MAPKASVGVVCSHADGHAEHKVPPRKVPLQQTQRVLFKQSHGRPPWEPELDVKRAGSLHTRGDGRGPLGVVGRLVAAHPGDAENVCQVGLVESCVVGIEHGVSGKRKTSELNCVRQIIRLGERENSHFESDPLRSVEVKAPQVEQAATGLAAVQWKHVQVVAFDAIPTAAALRAVPPVFNPGCKGMLAGNVSHAPKHDSAEVLRVLSGSCAPGHPPES